MALIDCPECGHRVSDKAASCPSCGVGIRRFIEADSSDDQATTIRQIIDKLQNHSVGTVLIAVFGVSVLMALFIFVVVMWMIRS